MKIFFLSKKTFGKLCVGNIGKILLFALIVSLVGSQAVRLKGDKSKTVSSQDVAVESGEVAVYTSPLEADDEVYILIDGKKTTKVKDNKAIVMINSSATIEIMSQTDKDFYVSICLAPNLEATGNTENLKCQKGINYICRCVVS